MFQVRNIAYRSTYHSLTLDRPLGTNHCWMRRVLGDRVRQLDTSFRAIHRAGDRMAVEHRLGTHLTGIDRLSDQGKLSSAGQHPIRITDRRLTAFASALVVEVFPADCTRA